MIRVRSVSPLDGFQLRVEFTDGTEREIDVESYLRGPVFEPVQRDRSIFEAVAVDPDLGAVVWPNGADIDPDVLYGRFEPVWAETGFSADTALRSKHGWSGRVAEPRPTPAYGVASREFTAVIHRDAQGFFVASVPELPGCEARARSRDELTQLVREAIRHAIDTHGEPAAGIEFVGVQVVEVPV